MLCLLPVERKVVSIFATSSPQCESVGWQLAQEALAEFEWEEWQSRQLNPSCTPDGVRSSEEAELAEGVGGVALRAESLARVGRNLDQRDHPERWA